MRGLIGKRVLITGGAGGIGAATAERFIEEGSRVVVIDRNQKQLDDFMGQHPKLDSVIHADVSKLEAVENAFRVLDDLYGGLDVLINNAGISLRHAFIEITPAEWRDCIR